jgi:putative oxidoreductase
MLSVLRVVAAAVFIEHGTQKLFGFPHGEMAAAPLTLLSRTGVAGVLETFGGLAILLGLFTRPVAFLLAGEMAVAYFRVHFPKSWFPIQNGGDNAVLFCFLYLYLIVAGSGIWSLDHLIATSTRSARSKGSNERTPVRPLRNDLEDRQRDAV